MSEICPYYKFRAKTLHSKEIGNTSTFEIVSKWCEHKHSKVTRKAAESVGGPKLTCGGVYEECMLTPEEYIDD